MLPSGARLIETRELRRKGSPGARQQTRNPIEKMDIFFRFRSDAFSHSLGGKQL